MSSMPIRARWPLALLALLLLASGIWFVVHRAPALHPDGARYLDHQPPLPLVAGFASFGSVADVTALLQSQQHSAARRTLARPPDSRYPPHALDTLTVEHFALLNTQGELSLQFFNDRLFEIDFKPDDAAACAAALARSDLALQRDRNGRSEAVVGDLRVAANVVLAANSVGQSLATEPYVLWQDLRLIRERDDWDQRFGALPYSLR
jgi:hypothetical protein